MIFISIGFSEDELKMLMRAAKILSYLFDKGQKLSREISRNYRSGHWCIQRERSVAEKSLEVADEYKL